MPALSVVCLAGALLAGCGANKPRFDVALVNLPSAAKKLRKKPRIPGCETPGKADLTVPQLENERDCYMGAEYRVRSQLNRLIDSTNQAEKARKKLARNHK